MSEGEDNPVVSTVDRPVPQAAASRANANAPAISSGQALAADRDLTVRRIVHYKVELPPCFHGDGKDKDSFSLWKSRLELSVKACSDYQQQDLATILPTRLSGDALAYWLSLAEEEKGDYDKSIAKLNEVFGRKQFLLHFQTFVNARQRLVKEPLEVFAAEITRLVLEAFPDYGAPAIAMERFRRFVAGLDLTLQAKCHEHGATTLEEALVIAGKWERAQEALKLSAPAGPQSLTLPVAATSTETVSAMVSTQHDAAPHSAAPELAAAVQELTADVRALRLEVDRLQRRTDHDYRGRAERDGAWQRPSRERERSWRSPSSSPDRHSAYRSHHSSHEGGYYARHGSSPGRRGRGYSPASPSRAPRSSSGQDQYRRPSPGYRRNSSPAPSYPGRWEHRPPHASSTMGRDERRSPSRYSYRPPSRERGQHVSFGDEDTIYQGNGR